jgi:hypothetical protein
VALLYLMRFHTVKLTKSVVERLDVVGRNVTCSVVTFMDVNELIDRSIDNSRERSFSRLCLYCNAVCCKI